jgi:choline kinase
LKETRIGYSDHAPIVAVILAGGQARRLGGGDKCLVELCRDEGEPRVILDYVLPVLTAPPSRNTKYSLGIRAVVFCP